MQRIWITCALLVSLTSGLVGQASPVVSLDDPVYRDIEKLVAFDMVDEIVFTARPYTRIEIARFFQQVDNKLETVRAELESGHIDAVEGAALREDIATVEATIERYRSAYAWEIEQLAGGGGGDSFEPYIVSRVSAGWVWANSRSRAVPYNGLGEIATDVNPLLQNRRGRHLVDGNTFYLEADHSITVSRHFAFALRPRAQLGFLRGAGDDVNEFLFQRMSGTFTVGNVRLTFGRETEFWGQGREAGLLISNNARGFDMIKLENDRPFRLPWILGNLGSTKMSLFVADLGDDQTFPHAKLVGYRLSLKPWRVLELGTGMLIHIGGDGAPDASLGKQLQDLFPFVENIFGRTWDVGSNKQAGVDARLRIPGARGLSFYYEGIIEDIDFSKGSTMFWEEAGHLLGMSVPRITRNGNLSLAAELHHGGVRLYRHHIRLQGLTLNRFIIGNNLGPDANAAHLFLNARATDNDLLEFHGAVEGRKIDRMRLIRPDYVRLETFPMEMRYRVTGSWRHWSPGERLSFGLTFGLERVTNFSFVQDSRRTNVAGEVFFSFEP